MRKTVTIGLICLVFFVSVAALVNNPQFSMIQNQNAQVQVQLTHQVDTIYTVDYFNQTTAQYVSTEGNDTVSLSSMFVFNETKVIEDDPVTPSTLNVAIFLGFNLTQSCYLHNFSVYLNIDSMGGITNWTIYNAIYNTTYQVPKYNVALYAGTFETPAENGDYWMNVTIGDHFLNISATENNTFFLCLQNYDSDASWYYELDSVDGDNSTMWKSNVVYARDYALTIGLTDRNYETTGSYVSSLIAPYTSGNGTLNSLTFAYDNYYPSTGDSELDFAIYISLDNGSNWYLDMAIPIGTNNTPAMPFVDGFCFLFYVNLTASSDLLFSPSFFWLELNYSTPVANNVPYLEEFQFSFDNETLLFTISCLALDDDADILNISLVWSDNMTYDTQLNIVEHSLVNFTFDCAYATLYEFYINVTDSEDTVCSDLFSFLTGAEPEEPPETPVLDIYLVLTIALAFLAAFITGGVLLHKGTIDSETRAQPKERRTRLLMLLLSHLLMGCGGRSTYSPSSYLVETGTKNKTSRVV